MTDIIKNIREFLTGKQAFECRARQIVAFRLATGVDLPTALASSGQERAGFIRRLVRLVERERQRGIRRHWSYDLNRHIALKQALDELRGQSARKPGPAGRRRRHRKRKAAPEAPPQNINS